MTILRKVLGNRQCGLRWRESVRAAMLDREIGRITRRVR